MERDLIPKPLYFHIHLCPLKRFLIRKSGTLSLFGDEVIKHHPVLLYKFTETDSIQESVCVCVCVCVQTYIFVCVWI